MLVCGGRDYANRERVFEVLDDVHAHGLITRIVHGGAGKKLRDGTVLGADRLAEAWADERRITSQTYPADWDTYGNSAGPRRNAEMLTLESPDLVIAFPGGRGTADMVQRAINADVNVKMVDPPGLVGRPRGSRG